jgi:translation elongation factor EF-Tu-like GTPase
MRQGTPNAPRDYPRDIEVQLHFLPTEAGGRKGPVFTGYRPQFFYDGHDWDSLHTYPGVTQVNPGDTVRAFLAFASPYEHLGRLTVGTVFLVREGPRTIAYGKVTAVLDLEQHAAQDRSRQGS